MKRVIITGANGFIGSSLVKKMIDHGVEVVAVDLSFATPQFPDSYLITKIESCVDANLMEKLPIDEYDAFYHLAWRGVNGIEKANPTVQLANIQMAIDCANVCKELKIKKLLCAGTVAENVIFSLSDLNRTNGGMMYGVAKYACHLIIEAHCKNIGLPFVWMQFSNIYGIGNRTGNLVSYTLNELIAGKAATFGPAQQPYDFIYVDDLLEAVYRLGKNYTEAPFYYIGSGSPRKLADYLIRIGELVGRVDKIAIGFRPDDGIRYSMDMFDNTDLISAIGNYVTTSFDEGIIKTFTWLKSLKTS